MPEVHFRIRWPDGALDDCYSPSTVIRDHLSPGEAYPLARFHDLAITGLKAANERVRARFGMGCSQALLQIARIEARTDHFADWPDAHVTLEAFLP